MAMQCMLVPGVYSKLSARGSIVARDTEGVAVQAGGHLEATDLIINGVAAVVAKVEDKSSRLEHTGCK